MHLGGHLYPAHIAAIAAFGSARTVSLLAGTLTAPLLFAWGRRLGFGTGAAWLFALFPLAVYTGALSAGDAPALFVAIAGATLATRPGWIAPLVGGALAASSVLVKPIALPALALLVATPLGLIGAAATAPLLAAWVRPIWAPMPHGGLLGSWWASTGGSPPPLADLPSWCTGGLQALLAQPGWAAAVVLPISLVALMPRWRQALPTRLRLAGLAPLLATWLIAAAFGERLTPRYLTAGLVATLPWASLALPRWSAAALAWLSAALIGQVAAYRAQADPTAAVPDVGVLSIPTVDARPLFDNASTENATAMRAEAALLAETLPQGATVRVARLPHGREGELVWPLRVARPDLRFTFE